MKQISSVVSSHIKGGDPKKLSPFLVGEYKHKTYAQTIDISRDGDAEIAMSKLMNETLTSYANEVFDSLVYGINPLFVSKEEKSKLDQVIDEQIKKLR